MLTLVALTWFTWTAANGVQSYTDERKRIPAAYREEAREFTPESLWDYPRTSFVHSPDSPVISPCVAPELP